MYLIVLRIILNEKKIEQLATENCLQFYHISFTIIIISYQLDKLI